MPSDKYVDLTLGVSGSTYTAPANGYVVAYNKNQQAGVVVLGLVKNGLRVQSTPANGFDDGACWIKVSKGDLFYLNYSNIFGSVNGWFRFIYVEGEVH